MFIGGLRDVNHKDDYTVRTVDRINTDMKIVTSH